MSKKKSGPVWGDKQYREALKALRASGLYRDLDPAHGYDLRPGKKLSFGAKMQIRKLEVQLAYINARSHVLVAPRTKSQEKQLKKALGIKGRKLKKFPVPVIPNQPVKVKIDQKGRIIVAYPGLGLEQITCPLDLKKIALSIDYSFEEEEQKDSLAEEYFRAAANAVRDVDDGDSYFRINSSSGDINPEAFARSQFIEDLRDYFGRMVNRYTELKTNDKTGEDEIQLLDFVRGISVWRNLKDENWTRNQERGTGYDYTHPLRITFEKGGIKAKRIPRHAVLRRNRGKTK